MATPITKRVLSESNLRPPCAGIPNVWRNHVTFRAANPHSTILAVNARFCTNDDRRLDAPCTSVERTIKKR